MLRSTALLRAHVGKITDRYSERTQDMAKLEAWAKTGSI